LVAAAQGAQSVGPAQQSNTGAAAAPNTARSPRSQLLPLTNVHEVPLSQVASWLERRCESGIMFDPAELTE
jgi:hypothetical protein